MMIVFSQYFNKNNFILFLGGCMIGSGTEYLISFLVEITMQTKWWDYSNHFLHINGRICMLYSIFWGMLTVILVKKLNPYMDKIIDRIRNKKFDRQYKRILAVIMLILMIDCVVTCFAQDVFITKMVVINDVEIKDKEKRLANYKKIRKNEYLMKFIDTYWNDEKMIKTFPNMKIEDRDNNIIYLDSLLPNVQPYYKKIF